MPDPRPVSPGLHGLYAERGLPRYLRGWVSLPTVREISAETIDRLNVLAASRFGVGVVRVLSFLA